MAESLARMPMASASIITVIATATSANPRAAQRQPSRRREVRPARLFGGSVGSAGAHLGGARQSVPARPASTRSGSAASAVTRSSVWPASDPRVDSAPEQWSGSAPEQEAGSRCADAE